VVGLGDEDGSTTLSLSPNHATHIV
jgi:hypothetical protein